ncbi:MAG TPA: hypothetical protein VMW50_05880, partial [Dehalococcoidia bacterium]|nr:hypothetical protein [Dehalococcoidia bacterium]
SAAGGTQQFQRDMAASAQQIGGFAGQAQARLAHMGEVAMKIGGTIAALRAGAAIAGAVVGLARNDYDAVVESLKKMPLGVGELLNVIGEVYKTIRGFDAQSARMNEQLTLNDATLKSWERFRVIVDAAREEVAQAALSGPQLGAHRLHAELQQRLTATENLSPDQRRIARAAINESYWAKTDAAAGARMERLQEELRSAQIAAMTDEGERGRALLDVEHGKRLAGVMGNAERGIAESIYRQKLANLQEGPAVAATSMEMPGRPSAPLYAARFLTGPTGSGGPESKTAQGVDRLVKLGDREQELDAERNSLLGRIADAEPVRILVVRANR